MDDVGAPPSHSIWCCLWQQQLARVGLSTGSRYNTEIDRT